MASAPTQRASAILRNPKLWIAPTALSAVLGMVLALLYMGGILDPPGSLHKLPVAIANDDQSAPLPGQKENLGAQITNSIVSQTPSEKVKWTVVGSDEAHDRLAAGKAFGVLVIPRDFTDTVAAVAAGKAAKRPQFTILTNPGMGSLGSSLATTITQDAAHRASTALGRQLTAQTTDPTLKVYLADPVGVVVRDGHAIGGHSGLGLSAFYYTLLLVLISFIAGNGISTGVDTALGYADSEIGPWHSRRPTVLINRTQTLIVKMVMTAAITLLTSSLLMVTTIGILGMDAHHRVLLWVFSYCVMLVVGLGVQAINAAFGGIGQLVSMLVFLALALPSSGAAVPLEAVPGFYRFLGAFEPMRQITDGVRSILYFDARADAGLLRAWLMLVLGFVLSMAFGFVMTRHYDRRGLVRRGHHPPPKPTA
ncbi:YhgE/Pip domain-containing protein [Streptomyces polyrhachis]|uniref:YhgE/Pip domain-containing protein n=1 Tax=Streptomyces polyrhachis TaxID=1282885 RepID=A0ABW2GES6_9ACTN